MKEEILKNVINKLREYDPEDVITAETPLVELILDSLDWVDFSYKLEGEYNIVFNVKAENGIYLDDITSLCDNVGDIADLVELKINNKKAK